MPSKIGRSHRKKGFQVAEKQILRIFLGAIALLVLFLPIQAYALPENLADISVTINSPWHDMTERSIVPMGERVIIPKKYRVVALDRKALNVILLKAPAEGSLAAFRSPAILPLPLPDGTMGLFQIIESPVMAPELSARFPDIRTWSGQGLDDPTSTVRLDLTPHGFHAMILSAAGRIFIDPYSRNDTAHYISYYTRDYVSPNAADFFEHTPVEPEREWSTGIQSRLEGLSQRSSGTQLRTYRLAVAATGEYTAFHGGTVALGLAAIVTAINRVTGIYEAEIAVRLQLVANNNLIVYTNAATDPYSNFDGVAMLGENQSNIDAVIGSANYDIGHVFSTGGGGISAVGTPCINGWKAEGVTGLSAPTGDAFWVDYVAHEMGHQFGGHHTFNSISGSCGGGNRTASTAYEPGSGSTIMAYAGICGTDDLQTHSDAYFHTISFDEIVAYTTTGSGSTCAVATATGNNPPVPDAGTGGFTIPANTPFTLTGSATDPDGDVLTFSWEEYDLGSAGHPGDPLNPPFFRSWTASTSPSRTFPRLSDLLNNTTSKGEVLPNVTSALTFRLTARDNRVNGGGVAYSTLNFNVTTAAGPFMVTSPNTAVTWHGDSSQTITWNVANTTASPVSCPNVGILLSTDGGLTFPITLAASVSNSGSQAVVIPNSPSATARVKVYCTSNVFFDISDNNFTITASSCTYALSSTSATIAAAGGTGMVTVTASSSGCAWTASESLDWVAITSGSSGAGSGTVSYSVSANTTGASRTGNITIAGQTLTITQAGASVGPIKGGGATAVYYTTLQEAYNAALNGDTVQSQAVVFSENLNLNRSISITINGGYDSSYSSNNGYSVINGTLTVSNGTAIINNIAVK